MSSTPDPPRNGMPPIRPGEILDEEFLQPTNTSVEAFATAASMPVEQVQAIVDGAESITADTANVLSAALGTTAQFWLNLQAAHDESMADIPEIDFTRAKFVRRGPIRDRRMGLRTLRVATGKTQVEVASAAEMGEVDVSRLEDGDDVLLSVLRRYVQALGGELDLVVTLPKTGHRIRLDL